MGILEQAHCNFFCFFVISVAQKLTVPLFSQNFHRYVLKTVFESAEKTDQNFIGSVSLIMYTIFVLVTIKYMAFVLRADNKGEGGTFALLGLLKGTEEPNSSIDIEKKSGNKGSSFLRFNF
jgi:K+ transporter